LATYVDALQSYPDAGLRFTEFCHLLADTREELHKLADQLGFPRRFFQDHAWRWHYDLPAHLRTEAIKLGAIEISRRDVALLLRARRAAIRPAEPERPR
jgi:hypothetical protein